MIDPIAVLISTYNSPNFLRLVLEGYRKQSDTNFVIYIADDGSGDETSTLIKAFQADFPVPIHCIWHNDYGFRKARVHNMAIKQIVEPYVILTDGDCIPLPRMIETHRRIARKGHLISGGRVLLSQQWTEAVTRGASKLRSDAPIAEWLRHRLKRNINRILPIIMPSHVGAPHQQLKGIRGCHISCWLDDLIRINGFDESFEGWGREDSDLVVRLFHAGIYRLDLRGMPVLHLWHKEEKREQLNKNDQLLAECLNSRRIEAIKGLKELQEAS
ncbi:MAG TPA: glycosyltransferase family 2 protein [Mariprofundaceae bacterium]|nr:glycosyltransferase family 2 protein [Mariprofundaceae bacterium]